MKRFISLLLAVVILFGASSQIAYANTARNIDNKRMSIKASEYGENYRLMVEKDGKDYYYSLNSQEESIPLQLGAGSYNIKFLKRLSGNSYTVTSQSNLYLQEESEEVFLGSNQPVYWEEIEELEKLAEELFFDLKDELQITKAAYDYVINNITYDRSKISKLNSNYVPSIKETIASQSGICYDYAALFAGLLRFKNIPTKLVKGYKNDMKAYHAWNEVLIEGEWKVVDTTYDSAYIRRGSLEMFKEAGDFNKEREY